MLELPNEEVGAGPRPAGMAAGMASSAERAVLVSAGRPPPSGAATTPDSERSPTPAPGPESRHCAACFTPHACPRRPRAVGRGRWSWRRSSPRPGTGSGARLRSLWDGLGLGGPCCALTLAVNDAAPGTPQSSGSLGGSRSPAAPLPVPGCRWFWAGPGGRRGQGALSLGSWWALPGSRGGSSQGVVGQQ